MQKHGKPQKIIKKYVKAWKHRKNRKTAQNHHKHKDL